MSKFCAIICEFNPFHNGHRYIISRAKELSGCDNLIVIISGSFTQRADICIADKFTRAKHAVMGGADCVLELPAAFSVAPAEIFARGAVKILSSIPAVKTIAFGCENGEIKDFYDCANILAEENEIFKNTLSSSLGSGESYIKSLSAAVIAAGGNGNILNSPNNILGTEYTKSIIKTGKSIKILPIKRLGANFKDKNLKENYSSASAIRANLNAENVKDNVPEFVLKDIKDFYTDFDAYEKLLKISLSRTQTSTLKRIYGCTEGLENKLKSLQNLPFNGIIEECCNKRYTASRIKRILLANFLRIYSDDCTEYLASPLYLKPLAVKKAFSAEILAELALSCYPVITCGGDVQKLNPAAAKCKRTDDFATMQWQQITEKQFKEKLLII